MRLCKIPCSYEQFEKIRDVIYANVPFAVIHVGYSTKLKIGIFNFWDTDYICDSLKQFILQPPFSRENKAKMDVELEDIVKSIIELKK